MGIKQAGRRRSGVMPEIKIRPDNGYARITIGGVRHALGKSPGGKISIEQEREAARLWLEHLNGSPQVSAPAWFIESCNRSLRAAKKPEITIAGRAANDYRFSEKQKKINREMEKKQAKPMNAVERVKDQARRLAAQRKNKR